MTWATSANGKGADNLSEAIGKDATEAAPRMHTSSRIACGRRTTAVVPEPFAEVAR